MSNASNFDVSQSSVSASDAIDAIASAAETTVVDGPVIDEDGDVVLSDEDTCNEADIEEAVGAFMLGDITLAQLEGISADEIYAIADLGYVVGPLLLGVISDVISPQVSLYFTATLLVGSGLLFYLRAPETLPEKVIAEHPA